LPIGLTNAKRTNYYQHDGVVIQYNPIIGKWHRLFHLVREPNLWELIHILCHCVRCVQSHSTKYDKVNCLYLAVNGELYALYTSLLFDKEENLVIHLNGVQVWQAMPNKPDCPGNDSTYNAENLGNNATTRDTLEQKTCSTSKTNTWTVRYLKCSFPSSHQSIREPLKKSWCTIPTRSSKTRATTSETHTEESPKKGPRTIKRS